MAFPYSGSLWKGPNSNTFTEKSSPRVIANSCASEASRMPEPTEHLPSPKRLHFCWFMFKAGFPLVYQNKCSSL